MEHHELVRKIIDEMDPDSKKALNSWYWYDWANQYQLFRAFFESGSISSMI